jgi:predicted TIM-barrel fold metal-dependent hydrolase
MMKVNNISKSIISISSPGTHLQASEDEHARGLTRDCNIFASRLKKERPSEFGFWASLPLPDITGALSEISYALDHLDADGFALLTNYHGTYLGHKALDPVFDELNRRKATVFIHPTTPCLSTGTSAAPMPEFPSPMFEFLFETARAIINLFLSGTVGRCPDIQFVIPHAGGTLPPLIQRFSQLGPMLNIPGMDASVSHAYVKDRLNTQFYFDTAGFSFPEQIQGLLQHVSVDRMLYGSDYPFTPLPAVTALSSKHDEWLPKIFSKAEDQEAVRSTNAKRLLKQS